MIEATRSGRKRRSTPMARWMLYDRTRRRTGLRIAGRPPPPPLSAAHGLGRAPVQNSVQTESQDADALGDRLAPPSCRLDGDGSLSPRPRVRRHALLRLADPEESPHGAGRAPRGPAPS